jgi:hypothetical protein
MHDPDSEWPVAVLCHHWRVVFLSRNSERRVRINDYRPSCMVQFITVEFRHLQKQSKILQLALKNGKESEIQPLLNLLNGEVTALSTWRHNNPDFLSSGDQQIKHR